MSDFVKIIIIYVLTNFTNDYCVFRINFSQSLNYQILIILRIPLIDSQQSQSRVVRAVIAGEQVELRSWSWLVTSIANR